MLHHVLDGIHRQRRPLPARHAAHSDQGARLLTQCIRLNNEVFELVVVALDRLRVAFQRRDGCRDIGQLGINGDRADGGAA